MNAIKFLDQFTKTDLTKAASSRREMFSQLGSLSKSAALAAVPFGLASMPSSKIKAAAASSGAFFDVTSALQLALTLEYLESDFYKMALESGVLSGRAKAEAIYMQISKHEDAHVALLENVLGTDAPAKPTFDFTANGAFDPFADGDNADDTETAYAQLLALAQAFEDTGVRAYKGQAGELIGTDTLTVALQIHSVEARHASEIRRLRGLQGWITGDNRGPNMPAATQPVYDGEANVSHGGVDVTTLGSGAPFTVEASTQAYDEPLTGSESEMIASLFITS